MTDLLNRIVKHKLPAYFVSPHLDDAALSTGCLMRYLAKKDVPVTVINVFTSASDGPQTFSARKFVKNSGYATAQSLFEARRSEDYLALSQLKVNVVNLNYTDAPWRRRPQLGFLARLFDSILPEVSHLYPIHRIHIANGKISPFDHQLINHLSLDLTRLITSQSAVVFCPEAIGGHVDHTLVKAAVSLKFNPIRWLDQPYLLSRSPNVNATEYFEFPVNHNFKKKLLRFYKTQIGQLFPSGKIPLLAEKFYYSYAK